MILLNQAIFALSVKAQLYSSALNLIIYIIFFKTPLKQHSSMEKSIFLRIQSARDQEMFFQKQYLIDSVFHLENLSEINLRVNQTELIFYSITSNQTKMEICLLDWDLKYQILKSKSNTAFGLEKPVGICFDKTLCPELKLYSKNSEAIIKWRSFLESKINQRGFHTYFKPQKKLQVLTNASLYTATNILSNQKVAVKAYSKEYLISSNLDKAVHNQIRLLRRLRDLKVIQFFSVFESHNSIYLVLPDLRAISLPKKIDKMNITSTETMKTIMQSFFRQIEKLHELSITLNQIKMSNLFVTESHQIRILDYTMATYHQIIKQPAQNFETAKQNDIINSFDTLAQLLEQLNPSYLESLQSKSDFVEFEHLLTSPLVKKNISDILSCAFFTPMETQIDVDNLKNILSDSSNSTIASPSLSYIDQQKVNFNFSLKTCSSNYKFISKTSINCNTIEKKSKFQARKSSFTA